MPKQTSNEDQGVLSSPDKDIVKGEAYLSHPRIGYVQEQLIMGKTVLDNNSQKKEIEHDKKAEKGEEGKAKKTYNLQSKCYYYKS